jgi:hypothetical protein
VTSIVQRPLSPKTIEAKLKAIVCECNRKVQQAPKGKKKKTCAELGTEKHDCCEEAIKKEGHDQIKGEKGYDSKGNPMPAGMTRTQAHAAGLGRGTCWPDAMACDAQGKPDRLYDFKFKCPAGTPIRKAKKGGQRWIYSTGKGPWPTWTKYKNGYTQKKKYEDLGAKMNPKVSKKPKVITNKGCRK